MKEFDPRIKGQDDLKREPKRISRSMRNRVTKNSMMRKFNKRGNTAEQKKPVHLVSAWHSHVPCDGNKGTGGMTQSPFPLHPPSKDAQSAGKATLWANTFPDKNGIRVWDCYIISAQYRKYRNRRKSRVRGRPQNLRVSCPLTIPLNHLVTITKE